MSPAFINRVISLYLDNQLEIFEKRKNKKKKKKKNYKIKSNFT